MRRFLGLGSGAGQHTYTGRISGNNAVDPFRPEDILTIKHGSNEYLFKYPPNTISSHALNVGHVRDKCAEITKVDPKRLSLICAGRQLKDNNATLQLLGIEHGAKILAVGSNAAPPSNKSSPQKAPGPPPKTSPAGPAEIIEAVRNEMRVKHLPIVEDFLNGNFNKEKRGDMHRRLSETIMVELLKLDGVETEDPELRARRKQLVREIQGTLDELDRFVREAN